jgi:hypothetical protein
MKDASQLKDAIDALDKELASLLSGRARPGGGESETGLDDVTGELTALYEQVGSADASPTAAQEKAAAHAGEELAEALKRWEHSKGTSIPALNRQLEAVHLPALNLEQKPETMPDSGDED